MKKLFRTAYAYCFVLLAISQTSVQAQTAPPIQWQNTIGAGVDDNLRSVHQTADGGYILGGFSNSDIYADKTENSQGGNDYWVVKVNGVGNIQWQNTIGGNNDDILNSIQQTTDGGYILGGYSNSNISGDKTENSQGGHDYWVVKLDATGNIQWQNTIGGDNEDILIALQQTSDGGYILGGHSNSNLSGDKTENSQGDYDYWVIKLDATGNIQWQNTIGGNIWDYFSAIQQTTDGGYILGGYSYSGISGDKTEPSQSYDYWVIKLDATGNILWQNTIGGNADDIMTAVQQTTDGGYILGGYSVSIISGDKTENCQGDYDYWVVKLDATGNIQWQNTIGGSSEDDLYSLQQTADGGYILGGYSNSTLSGDKTENSQGYYDYWVVKLDATGNIQWQNTIGGNNFDQLYSIQQTSDGGYIMGGHSYSNISGDKTENNIGGWDYWLLKLSPPPPPCSFPVSITGTDCFVGATTSLKANPAGAYTYLWSTAETTRTIAAAPGTYCVTVTKTATGGTCTACITICKKPTLFISPVTSVTICNEECIPLKALAGNNCTYQWSGGPASATWTVCPTAASTIYTVTATNNSGCSAVKTVTVKTVSCASASGCAPPWNKSEVRNSNDTEDTSDNGVIFPDDSDTPLMRAYPNPASNELFLDYSNQAADIKTLALYDMTGRKVLNIAVSETGFDRVDISKLPAGLYILKINETMAMRIVLAR